jgi:O-antigen/teichoic acid export membrane protein
MQVLITLLTAPLYSNKNVGQILIAYVGGAATSILLNVLLIPSFGLIGAAIGMASSFTAIVLIMGIANYKMAKFRFLDKRLLFIAAFFPAFWIVSAYTRGLLNMPLCIGVSLAGVLVVVSLLVGFALDEQEKSMLFSLVSRAGKSFFVKGTN